jgi:hypothetical protein
MIDIHEMLKTNPSFIPESLTRALVRQAVEVEIGRMYAASGLVPKEFQGNAAACAVIVGMADRMGLDPLTLMQNVAFVSGRPTWKATFAIALANRSGDFKSGLQFRTAGSGRQMKVTCFAERVADGRLVEETVTMEMAEADGWTKNPKYKSLPEVMLSYRAAMFFVRKNCPELLFGLPAEDEVEQQAVEVRISTPEIANASARLASIASRSAPELTGPVASEPELPREDWQDQEQRDLVLVDEPLVEAAAPPAEQQVDVAEPEVDEELPEAELERIGAEVDALVATLNNGPERLAMASKGKAWRDDLEAARKVLAWASKAAAAAAEKAKTA